MQEKIKTLQNMYSWYELYKQNHVYCNYLNEYKRSSKADILQLQITEYKQKYNLV